MDKGLEKENRTKIEISHSFEKNIKLRNSDVEWNIEKIVRKAFSKIDFDIAKTIDLNMLIQKTFFNSSSILKQIKRRQDKSNFRLDIFSLNLKLDVEVKFSPQRLKASFNTSCMERKYLNNSILNVMK